MLATVDSRENAGLRVQVPTVQLTRIGKLENALTNLHSRTVHLIEEEDDSVVTSLFEPVGSVPAGRLPIDGRKAHKVALGHL